MSSESQNSELPAPESQRAYLVRRFLGIAQARGYNIADYPSINRRITLCAILCSVVLESFENSIRQHVVAITPEEKSSEQITKRPAPWWRRPETLVPTAAAAFIIGICILTTCLLQTLINESESRTAALIRKIPVRQIPETIPYRINSERKTEIWIPATTFPYKSEWTQVTFITDPKPKPNAFPKEYR